ncbi:transposase [Spirosoma taeanense]|uniref:Transposase n=1 Tax=Spirosoma taeanense TaxID=2735870 RepID=A0A6M5YBC2_9BACT|nr:transposase [Spirosoma taeanense]QJW90834.1 transposase [Spirosoma taeanense]
MQLKNKPINRRKYDATFKADVLKMIANGQSVAYVAQALGISEALIYKWKQRTKGEEKHHSSGQASEMLIENQRLLQRINQLETEREILKKALAIISRQT